MESITSSKGFLQWSSTLETLMRSLECSPASPSAPLDPEYTIDPVWPSSLSHPSRPGSPCFQRNVVVIHLVCAIRWQKPPHFYDVLQTKISIKNGSRILCYKSTRGAFMPLVTSNTMLLMGVHTFSC